MKGETACYSCGASAEKRIDKKTLLLQKFCKVVNVGFYICVILTVISIVTSGYVPSFTKCIGATVILHFVKSSADQMVQNGQNS